MSGWPRNRPPADSEPDHSRWHDSDREAGFEIDDNFSRFSQIDDMFSRAFCDPSIASDDTRGFFDSYRMQAAPRRGEGFAQRDFALRNAAWSVSDMVSARRNAAGKREGFTSPIEIDTPIVDDPLPIDDSHTFTAELKGIARLLGASLVGIADHDQRWVYSARVDIRDFSETENSLPDDISHVIVLGHAMDADLVDTYPSALAGASTGLEYSHEAAISIQLASYIRNLGYQAIPSMNDTGLVIPLAIKAGLGEYGRNQMLLTREFGPRLRFSKIYTSLPLIADQPRIMGIGEYCKVCTKCAAACPPKALPFGEATAQPLNRSNISGVKKWTADCEKCFGYWAKLKTDCAICMRVCPFNRDYRKLSSRVWRALALSRFRKIALWWDKHRPTGARIRAGHWWRNIAS
jgi:epoxyqueuosine reductase QueG